MNPTKTITEQIEHLKAQRFTAPRPPNINKERISKLIRKEFSFLNSDVLTVLIADPEFVKIDCYDNVLYAFFIQEETLEQYHNRIATETAALNAYNERKQKWQERIERRLAILESMREIDPEYKEYLRLKQKYA